MSVNGTPSRTSDGHAHSMLTIRVAVVDDHVIVRSALRAFFEEHSDITVVAEAATGKEAIDIVEKFEVDVLVMDLSMPQKTGMDVLPAIHEAHEEVAILIFSSYPEQHYAINLIRQGASGYLNKQCDPQDIVTAVRRVASGHRYISPAVAHLLAEQLDRPGSGAPHERLSPRERSVFLSLAQGASVGAIASRLDLNVKTVSTYRSRLLEKMLLHTNSDLTYYAVKNQLIS